MEKMHFTGYCRCPHCRTGLIIVDNKAVSCPVCELRKDERQVGHQFKEQIVPQSI
jgi:exosome complex RNA-binding protein Csl4